MKYLLKLILILLWINDTITTKSFTNSVKILSRKKRLVAFPEGSSISVAAALHIGILGAAFNHGHMGIVWGVSYELPNETWVLDRLHNFQYTRPNENDDEIELSSIRRRSRRDLYQKLEIIIENLGYSGRDCMLRTLCESSKYFPKERDNMIIELLKTTFDFPIIKNENEQKDIMQYDRAFRQGQNSENCVKHYHRCKISLLEHLFGQINSN